MEVGLEGESMKTNVAKTKVMRVNGEKDISVEEREEKKRAS